MKLSNIKPYWDLKRKAFQEYADRFGFSNSLKYFLVQLCQERLDPHLIPSYSQTGEDRIIMHLLNNLKKGFYVDVGCNHPQSRSNTFELYKKGWNGINIDANEKLIKLHQTIRPKDVSLCAAISEHPGEAVFTEFSESCVSSLSDQHVQKWKERCDILEQRVVQTIPLTQILDDLNAPRAFDLLSVDVEGYDYEVLKSLNLERYRPRLIVVEISKFNFLNPDSHDAYQYLINCNYALVGYAIVNAYFLDKRERVFS